MTIKVAKYAWNSVTTGGSPPAMTGQAGQAIAVLDHCLTDTLGWTKTVLATNIALYTMNGGSGNSLYVDDTGTTAARVKGMEAGVGVTINDWVNPFPSEAHFAGGLYMNKSTTADATARSWFFWGSPTFFHIVVITITAPHGIRFGDPLPINPVGPEVGNTFIVGNINAAPSTSQSYFFRGFGTEAWTVAGGNYIARSVTGIGGSYNGSSNPDTLRCRVATNEIGSAGLTYPSVLDGGMGISKFYIGDVYVGPRGVVPGMYIPCHGRPIPNYTSFTGAVGSPFEGKTLECVYGASDGCILAETSDTWDTVA